MYTQGSITSTGNSLDAAISGNGFFVVSTGGGLGFTRAGSFGFNALGELVSSDGLNVMGYEAVNGKLNSGGSLTPIVINKGQSLAPKKTENASVAANLDSQLTIGKTFSTSVQIYDSLGTKHDVNITFGKTAIGKWSWSATIPATDQIGGAITDPAVEIGSGEIDFDSNGKMDTTTTTPNPGTLSLTSLSSGAANFDVTFNLLDSNKNPLITSYASESAVSSTTQDGSAASVLKDVSIDNSGTLVGTYDDGQVQPLAQLAVADFPNVEGLMKYVGSTLVPFLSSGDPSIGVAGTGGRGTIVGGSLEQSNVDMAQEFTNLIIAQRAYQANSKVITTTDQLYTDVLNMKQ
jgi:flagellar hook protein FlgE